MKHALVIGLLRLERSHVDREAVLHIRLEQSLVGFVDLLDGDDFHVGGKVVLPAEVEHLLGFGDAADARTGEAAAAQDQAERGNRQRLLRGADERDVAIAPQQIEVSVYVVIGGDSVENEVEAAGVFLHLVRVLRNDDLVRSEPGCVFLLLRRSREDDNVRSERVRNLHAHVPESSRPTTPTFLPLLTPQWRIGEYVVIPAQSKGAAPAGSRFEGTRRTNLWSTTMRSE